MANAERFTVLIALDTSEQSIKAFNCKYYLKQNKILLQLNCLRKS